MAVVWGPIPVLEHYLSEVPNMTFLRYQSGRSAPMLMKLNNPNINSVNVTNLQWCTSYYFTVVVNTTTFINESNTASIYTLRIYTFHYIIYNSKTCSGQKVITK